MTRQLPLLLFLLFFTSWVTAQSLDRDSKKKQKLSQQDEQRLIDEQLASQYFKEQDYQNARDLYQKLYKKTGQTYHFQQYIECSLILKEYEDAEKALKSFYKSNPNYTKSLADIVYVYLLEGKTDKADRQFKEILNTLPPKSQIIRNLGSNFQS